jgi:hypothetical protein
MNEDIVEKRVVPTTQEERKLVQATLIEYSKKALNRESLGGLNAFIRSFHDKTIEYQIHVWLQQFSPIQVTTTKNGRPVYERKQNLSEKYDISKAHLDPYYSVDVRPEKITQKVSINHKSVSKSSAISDAEFQRRNIRNTLELVLREPTEINKDKLIKLIRFYEIPKKHGPPMFQAGSPGLSKRR